MEKLGLGLLEQLEQAGYEAYFVGGYVRDKYLGKPVKDIDIATSARPEEVVKLFTRTIPTGLKHGTVTVLAEGETFEVTTFRKESDYADFRRPDEVEFISELEEDLRRRDFTMNAMAMDKNGVIRDPFGGKDDLQAGLLRCVGDPAERFREDALRMLRCVRFAAVYGLAVDEATWQAVLERRELLLHVAMERVRVELERMMAGPHPVEGWRLLAASGLLAFTKEALDWPYSAAEGCALPAELGTLAALEDAGQRWILLLLTAGMDAKRSRELLRKLTFSLKDLERFARAAEFHQWASETEWTADMARKCNGLEACSAAEAWQLAALQIGVEAASDWLAVMEALERQDYPAAPGLRLPVDQGREWLNGLKVRELKELALTGGELIAASGRSAGPWVGAAMSRLLRLAAVGRVANIKQELLEAALKAEGGA
ncbi:CCA tRNA nucleotidyltransferase [Paenibacillus sp. YN15]|uniref:CCA tRNA nucleotidyltransferase n=1 Tax=Paenibacillus sp. YN15 TaxID=1742774 RepID=UPI0015ECA039|nr:CCA tRNA nucleotidyltransferase [Paenibacillus sp. YN15]